MRKKAMTKNEKVELIYNEIWRDYQKWKSKQSFFNLIKLGFKVSFIYNSGFEYYIFNKYNKS